MNDVMGIINLVGNDYPLEELTQHRPLATVPFGGRYRLIDFALSGLLNSGVDNVGILAPPQQRSVFDHLRSGKDWQLARKKDGLTFLLPTYEQLQDRKAYEVASLHGNLEFLSKSGQNLVMILPGGAVGNFDFRGAFRSHRKTGADVTLLYKQQRAEEYDCGNHIGLDLASDGRVRKVFFQPSPAETEKCFWGALILRKELLTSLIKECYASGMESLIAGLVPQLDHLKIRAYHYSGYLARIHCLQSYYRHSMGLLEPEIWQQLFKQPGKIYTKIREENPTKYGDQAEVAHAVIASGCLIRGAVDHSILFRRVAVDQGASITHSILMSNTAIAKNATLEYVICDKDVKVTAGQVIRGQADRPLVIKKGSVI